VWASGSNVTLAPETRAGLGASNNGSTRTVPVKCSADPLADGCDPPRLISIVPFLNFAGPVSFSANAASGSTAASVAKPPVAASMLLRVIIHTPLPDRVATAIRKLKEVTACD
jgi:hypothetical protein